MPRTGSQTPQAKNEERLAVQAFTTECELVRTSVMPPEGQQHPLNSWANTLVLAYVVAENAAKKVDFASEQSQAAVCDAERACAIDLWIARCPIEIPVAILVGIKAIIQASASRRL
jgi:hypothetical protein